MQLTPREREVAGMVALGWSNKVIAYVLGIAEGTVKDRLTDVYRKNGLSNRTALAVRIYQERGVA